MSTTQDFDYSAASMAAYRVIDGTASDSDLEIAADFQTRNDYVRRSETIPCMSTATFGAVREALLLHVLGADTDAGEYAGVGTADGRVIRSEDVTVYRVNDNGEREVVRVDKGGKSASRDNGRTRKIHADRKAAQAAASRAYRARKKAQREAATQPAKTDTRVTVQTATATLPRMAWLADE